MTSDNVSNVKETKMKVEYLKELLMDRIVLSNYPHLFLHVSKILEKEISRTRSALLSIYGIYPISDSDLPEPAGPKVNLQCKVYMPSEANSSFNFVGRILGPDGSTAKCLQQCLGVKIMVRGRGSMRDRKKEEANIGRPNWEHLSDKLHVVLTVDDFESRAKARLAKASDYITLFLKESTKGSDREDKVKQMQLMELSFQRDLRSSWSLDCHNLMELGKTGSLYPGPANVLNFAYPAAYPPAPLFSAIHEAPQQHHSSPPGFHTRHYYSPPGAAQQVGQQTQPAGQQQQQQQQQHQQSQPQQQQTPTQQQPQHSQGHFTSVPASHGGHVTNANGANALHNNQQMAAAAAAAAMSVGGLAFPSSTLSTNLGNATLLLGPTNTQGHQHHHPGAYSPPVGVSGQVTVNSASALPAGTVAVAPMNYWQTGASAGPHALSQMTAAATLDYHHAHLHHHQHQMHQTGHEHMGHVPQAAGYPLPAAPYATAAHLHPLGFSGEIVQPTLGQEYSLCSHDSQQMESTGNAGGAIISGVSSVMPLISQPSDGRCTEAASTSVQSVGIVGGSGGGTGVGNSESTGNDTAATEEPSASTEKPGKHMPANVGVGASSFTATAHVASGKNTSTAANQASSKYSIGAGGSGGKQRYSQKHHSQFNVGRSSQQQTQQVPLSIHSTQQLQQHPHGSRTGRSEIVTVHVGSSDQSSTTKPGHGNPGGEAKSKGGLAAVAKQKHSSTGSPESPGVKSDTHSTGNSPAMTGKEARGGTNAKSQAVSKKSTLTPVVSSNDDDWPKLGTDAKVNKCNAASESQIAQGVVNLSIGSTGSKAI